MDYQKEEFEDGKGRTRNGSPIFYKLLEEMANTHDRKSHDYASNENPFGNYHFAGQVSSLFAHSVKDAGFAGRIAEKVYRLANLEGSQKTVSNESIEDTEKDICVITLLWMADRRNRRESLNQASTDGARLNSKSREDNSSRKIQDNLECQIIEIAQQMTPQTLERSESYLREVRLSIERHKSVGPYQK